MEFKSLSFERPRAVFLAILFHDAIYIPGRKDNEEKSAQLARMALAGRDGLPDEEIAAIERMIRLTASHQAHAGSLSADEAKFLDIDLAILGMPWGAYEEYLLGIRREYTPNVVRPAVYRAGRLQFLTKLLKAPRIFVTDEMEALRGEQARGNIQRECRLLKGEQNIFERLLTPLLLRLR